MMAAKRVLSAEGRTGMVSSLAGIAPSLGSIAPTLAKGGLVLAMLSLGGCVIAGPTYGTDKRVGEQLVEDLASVTSLRRESVKIDYKPRPGLVPAPEGTALPAPQDSLSERDAAFQNSPERLRERMAAEGSLRGVDARSVSAQTKRYDPETGKRIDMRKRAARIGSPDERRVLTDPPVEYRQAAATAPTGDVGVPEYKKERARKKLAGADDDRGFLRKLLPF